MGNIVNNVVKMYGVRGTLDLSEREHFKIYINY